MFYQQDNKSGRGLQYATSFDEKLFGVGCDVEIVVDTESGDVQAVVAMRSFLRSTPAFRISVVDLIGIAKAIESATSRAKLLEQLIDDATDHQLNYSVGGAMLVVVHPKGKKARYTLHIGAFHREGEVDKLSASDITEALNKVEELTKKVRNKVMLAK